MGDNNNKCFLCLDTCDVNPNVTENCNERRKLCALANYLTISSPSDFPTKSTVLLLCEECKTLLGTFQDLLKLLEIAKLKVDSCLRQIRDVMLEGNKMESEEKIEKMGDMRRIILSKSIQEVMNSQPTVKLNRLRFMVSNFPTSSIRPVSSSSPVDQKVDCSKLSESFKDDIYKIIPDDDDEESQNSKSFVSEILQHYPDLDVILLDEKYRGDEDGKERRLYYCLLCDGRVSNYTKHRRVHHGRTCPVQRVHSTIPISLMKRLKQYLREKGGIYSFPKVKRMSGKIRIENTTTTTVKHEPLEIPEVNDHSDTMHALQNDDNKGTLITEYVDEEINTILQNNPKESNPVSKPIIQEILSQFPDMNVLLLGKRNESGKIRRLYYCLLCERRVTSYTAHRLNFHGIEKPPVRIRHIISKPVRERLMQKLGISNEPYKPMKRRRTVTPAFTSGKNQRNSRAFVGFKKDDMNIARRIKIEYDLDYVPPKLVKTTITNHKISRLMNKNFLIPRRVDLGNGRYYKSSYCTICKEEFPNSTTHRRKFHRDRETYHQKLAGTLRKIQKRHGHGGIPVKVENTQEDLQGEAALFDMSNDTCVSSLDSVQIKIET